MENPCEIRSIARKDHQELVKYVGQFERIILITPNYIHAIPSEALQFLYELPKAAGGQSLGFIIQSGYPEGAESEIICRYFKRLAARLEYDYLGTVVKGDCAGLATMPQMFGKLEKKFAEFGVLYEQTGGFDKTYTEEFAKPYTLP